MYDEFGACLPPRYGVWREAGVASIPVSPFYVSPPKLSVLRFCFAKNDSTLEAAAERLCKL